METVSEHALSKVNETHSRMENSLTETLGNLEHDVNDVVDALALLGIKRCSQCRKFFRWSEPGALFDHGALVCYVCVADWWQTLSEQISVLEREKAEAKLSSWLRKYHNAEVIREDRQKSANAAPTEFEIVVHCTECRGSGKLLEGERCRFCNGFGTVRVAVPK